MRGRIKPVLLSMLFIIALLCMMPPAQAQITPVRPADINPYLDSLFTGGCFEEIEIEALRTLRQQPPAKIEERIAAYLYLGFVEVLSGRPGDARGDFLLALDLRPTISLDPVYVPPMIFEVFEEAKRSYVRQQLEVSDKPHTTEPVKPEMVPVSQERHGVWATMTNMTIPGGGFLLEGRFIRGTMWTLFQAGSVAGFVYSFDKTLNSREDYMATVDPSEFDAVYNRYNRWYQRSWAWGAAGVAVYLASQVDFFLSWNGVEITSASIEGPGGEMPGVGIILPLPSVSSH